MPGKQWEEEEESSSSGESAPKVAAGAIRRGKFDDEEAEDSDVLESWDADDSEAEREKAKKAAEAKARADAAALASKKSKTQRIEEHKAERARQQADEDDSSDEETESQKRERLRQTEKEADLRHAQDLFHEIGTSSSRKGTTAGTAVVIDASDPSKTVDLSILPIFNPVTKPQFDGLLEALVSILADASKRPHYFLFLQELSKQLARDLPSDQIKKISSTLTALSNEKLKEEKTADKGGKKSKAQKTKTTLAISRPNIADTNTYEETFAEDDFM